MPPAENAFPIESGLSIAKNGAFVELAVGGVLRYKKLVMPTTTVLAFAGPHLVGKSVPDRIGAQEFGIPMLDFRRDSFDPAFIAHFNQLRLGDAALAAEFPELKPGYAEDHELKARVVDHLIAWAKEIRAEDPMYFGRIIARRIMELQNGGAAVVGVGGGLFPGDLPPILDDPNIAFHLVEINLPESERATRPGYNALSALRKSEDIMLREQTIPSLLKAMGRSQAHDTISSSGTIAEYEDRCRAFFKKFLPPVQP